MIFKTVNDELTGATNQLSLFGKTFRQINEDVNKGYGLKAYFKILPKEDINNLNLYVKGLQTATDEQIIFDKYLKQSSTTAQILGKKIYALKQQLDAGKISTKEYNASVNSMIAAQQSATISANFLKAALKTMGNILVSLVIDQIITQITNFVQAQEEARQAAQELSKQFNDDVTSIDNYIVKIKQLRTELDDSNTLESQRKSIKEDLLKIQNDLIETYGFEADGLDIVNGKIEDNIKLMRQYLKEEYQDTYRKNSSGIESSVNSLNSPKLTIMDEGGLYAIPGLQSLLDPTHAIDVYGVNKKLSQIYQELGIGEIEMKTFPDDIYTIDKKLEDAQKRIEELMKDDNLPKSIYQMYDDAYKYIGTIRKDQVEKIIKDNEDNLVAYIKGNENYSDIYFDLFISKANYQEAVKSGDQKAIDQATQSWIDAYNKAIDKAVNKNDPAIKNYFIKNFSFEDTSQKSTDNIIPDINPVKEKLTELDKALDGVYDSFDTAFSNQSTIQSAFDKIQSGTDLTTSEMKSLIKLCKNDFPEIGTLFTKTAKGWTISSDDLIRANNALMKSTKETVQQQIDGYNEVIRTYENRFVTIPKGGQTIQIETDVGISEEEYKNATEQVENLKKVLETLGLVVDGDTDKMEQFTKTLKTLSTNISAGVSAQKEMNESGKISASTLESLLSLGDDYIKCISIENGVIKFNADTFKEVTKAKLDDEIATLKLAQAEAIHARIEDAQYNKGKEGAKLQAIIDETNLKLKAAQALRDGLDETWDNELKDKSGSSNDPIKDAFQAKEKELKHLLAMEKITQEQYYEMLFGSEEYKKLLANREKYLDELNSLDEEYYKYQQNKYADDADKQFDDLEDQYKKGIISAEQYAKAVSDLGQELYGEDSLYGGTEFAKKKLEELDKTVKEVSDDIYSEFKEGLGADGDKTLFNILSDAEELWNKTNELFAGDLTTIKSNAKDIFGTVSSALEDSLKKGIITVDGYESLLRSWGDTLEMTEADITDALVDTYEYRADALQKANDGSLASERKYIADMKSLNFSTYGDENSDFYDPNTYASNLRDITDHELDVLEEALKKGEISTREYAEEVAKILGDADVLGADYIAEKQEEIDKVRAEREKEYWEQQKELVEDYYDKQIEELEKIQDEQEKITKAEELRLNLIKARKTLEEAKNNRNQLVFHDGTFEYMADQDAVMSAEEEVAEAVKAIKDNELQEQIDLLKSQKDEALSFYDDMISMIDAYINETVNISESDSETLKKIADSRYSKEWKDVRYGDKTANEVTEEQKKAVEKSEDKSDTKADSNDKVTVKADSVEVKTDTNSSTDIQSDNVPEPDDTASTDTVSSIATTIKDVANPLLAFINSFGNGSAFENLVRALGGNPTAEAVKNFKDSYNATLVGKNITPSTVDKVVNNSNSTTNNNSKSVVIEKLEVNLQLTVESLEDFVENKIEDAVDKMGKAIQQRIPAILAKA